MCCLEIRHSQREAGTKSQQLIYRRIHHVVFRGPVGRNLTPSSVQQPRGSAHQHLGSIFITRLYRRQTLAALYSAHAHASVFAYHNISTNLRNELSS